jgi:hypothetical protein
VGTLAPLGIDMCMASTHQTYQLALPKGATEFQKPHEGLALPKRGKMVAKKDADFRIHHEVLHAVDATTGGAPFFAVQNEDPDSRDQLLATITPLPAFLNFTKAHLGSVPSHNIPLIPLIHCSFPTQEQGGGVLTLNYVFTPEDITKHAQAASLQALASPILVVLQFTPSVLCRQVANCSS